VISAVTGPKHEAKRVIRGLIPGLGLPWTSVVRLRQPRRGGLPVGPTPPPVARASGVQRDGNRTRSAVERNGIGGGAQQAAVASP
jgi:hypothetical protein